jgi:hypothetical protein
MRAVPCPRGWRIAAVAVALAAVLGVGGCNGQSRPNPPPAQAADSAVVVPVDLVTADRTVRDYFALLAEGRTAEARDLLASGPRSDMSAEEMAREAAAVRQVRIRTLEPLRTSGEQIVFQALLYAAPEAGAPGGWEQGPNTRWIELVHGRRGWRIARIAREPISVEALAPVTAWAQVHILDGGISLDVPNGWVPHPRRWAWSPPGRPTTLVEVHWYEGDLRATPGADGGARLLRAVPVEADWGSGTEYVLEMPAPAADSAAAALHRTVFHVRSSDARHTVVIVGEASDSAGMRAVRSVMRRMLTSAEFATPSGLTAEAPAHR